MIRFALFVSAALALMAPAAQALTVLEDRAAFDAASTESFFDDYEDIDVAPGTVIAIGSPLVRGPVTYATSTGGIAALGMNTLAPGSIRLAPNFFTASFDIDISFSNGSGVTAIGFDLQGLTNPIPGDPVAHTISLFDTSNSLIGDFTKLAGTTAMFVGILSDVEIGRIVIDDQSDDFGSVIDNLSLGTNTGPTTPVPLPASGLLLLAALVGGGVSARRARSAA